ncbi:putative ATPase (AAA+ superfamily) [Desulfitobacterium dichloroeliminans LMG P-21439]|uniref:Putative ATPase (AAA+ superfamily) n=1 Tax=Desulfitobacterium dichloroeliminans (strain LMG P-21439 / DCA1) TaxID=871963 RepID=L0F3N9_DESDL|nr:DUF499 domain-containing protein [Desulfitobacterium dichloroeliminans]AGA67680.1 putative ATPase (AAA+ superfamily) [Desulfitobacterium dichloroeliminans LMG P-21439]
MRTINEMLKPRENVFSDTAREDVLNLTDLAENRIDANKFFGENFQTQGMTVLFDTAFARFKGESDTGVIKLTQAMGGGKTHSMLALALLAQNAELREKLLGPTYAGIGEIRVVSFSGRENADFGIWGSIAEQLGKKEFFKDYYSPLKAPGEKSWVELLKGQKTLILLDELPPYLENAKSIMVGNSDLSKVTMTALSNLFTALGKEQLANVCLVFSDLKAAYESGSELLQSSFRELEAEANRIAIEVTPVALNSDEIYHILQKRLFEDVSGFEYSLNINDVAIAYKTSVEKSKKLGFTNYTPEAVFKGIKDSYPFHPSIKDLYARFKENQNFQQTRGLIKLMRQIVRQFYESDMAKENYLINVFDFDLNEQKMLSHIRQIKPSLEEAINHDIAQDGKSIAEVIDIEKAENKGVTQDIAKLLLVSSLSTANHGLLGLTESEIFGYLSAPNTDINEIKSSLEELKTLCWYMKQDNRGRLYFQNTKNMVAEMNTLVDSYTNENAKKELKRILEQNFSPKLKVCYEMLYVLPAIDEIDLDQNKISLVIYEPYPGSELHPELKKFHDNISLKNRVMFLSGQRNMMEKLYGNSKKLKAIQQIVDNMANEGVPASDQQYKEAEAQLDKAIQALFSTIRETFVALYYPTKNGIELAEFKLEFKENKFNGEEQIISCLTDSSKYEAFSKDDQFLENLRKKCEARLFTIKELPFSQIKERAATTVAWQWYHPDQLESLRLDCIKKDKWREINGYLVKGPFEKDPTSVVVEQTSYDETTQEFTLKIRGIGGRVYYDIGSDPTSASKEVMDQVLVTAEPAIRFVCIDPTGERKTGDVVEFTGSVPIKYGQRNTPNGDVMTLVTNPKYVVKYTTDGSEPKENGGIYNEEFVLPQDSKYVRVAVYYKDRLLEEKSIYVTKGGGAKPAKTIDKSKALAYRYHNKKQMGDTEASYKELALLSKLDGVLIKGATAEIYNKTNTDNYIEFNASVPYWAGDLQSLIDLVRDTSFKETEVIVDFGYKELMFLTGELFTQWLDMNKFDLNNLIKSGEIIQ